MFTFGYWNQQYSDINHYADYSVDNVEQVQVDTLSCDSMVGVSFPTILEWVTAGEGSDDNLQSKRTGQAGDSPPYSSGSENTSIEEKNREFRECD